MTDAERLGRQLKKARDAKGWSQKDLEDAYTKRFGGGAKERTIQSWEAGERMPRGRTLTNLRMILGLAGSEEEAREEWPERVHRVVDVISDQLGTLEAAQLKAWRHAIIAGLVAPSYEARGDWPDDVVTVAEILGQYLHLGWDEGPDAE